MDWNTIIVAGLSLIGTLGGTFAGIITSTKLSNYRIEQLEKKQEKHNNLIERTYKLEEQVEHIFYEIDEVKNYVKFHESKVGG